MPLELSETIQHISHLNSTHVQPSPTSSIQDLCLKTTCENGGVCTVQDGKAECRCRSGEDWWYMGERCEKRGSTQDTIVIAVSSTVAVFALMLIVTLVSVYCTRKKYRKKMSSNTANSTLRNRAFSLFYDLKGKDQPILGLVGQPDGSCACKFSPLGQQDEPGVGAGKVEEWQGRSGQVNWVDGIARIFP
ncbi:Meprin A subunit beta [Saguinus oedipus]|uniref:Meprin A subunit beta n=1 Tax=Saguinus oedipus TaxID=9490 RepID=A0ABQ9UBN0_SAGOE|nr:Meprin A subunit beta [Saguinus oedipus]